MCGQINIHAPKHELDATAALGLSHHAGIDLTIPVSVLVIENATSFVTLGVVRLASDKIC